MSSRRAISSLSAWDITSACSPARRTFVARKRCSWRRYLNARADGARDLVMRYGWNAVSYKILHPGMRLRFSRAGDAVVGYALFGRVWIIAGAPVCAPERLSDVALEIEADAGRRNERVMFFGAGARLERAYAARGDHSLVCIGAQPTWEPSAWSGIVQHKASLRAQTRVASIVVGVLRAAHDHEATELARPR